MFNEGRYYERMKNGEFRATILRERLVRRGDRRVRKTKSQTVEYLDRLGRRIAIVHQYRKHDGSLGGSGLPDPKILVHDGVRYILDQGEQWDLPEW
jgi:hypothetical protein